MILRSGESIRLTLKSQADKSAFIELTFPEGRDKVTNATLNQQVLFYVYNNRLKDLKKFDMTQAGKVLLPQSTDTFTVYLAAQNGNYNITLTASKGMIGAMVSIAVGVLALTLSFLF